MRTLAGLLLILAFLASASADQPYIYSLRAGNCSQYPYQRMLTAFRMAGTRGLVTALHGVVDSSHITATNRCGPPIPGSLQVYDVDVAHDLARVSNAELERQAAIGLQLDPAPTWQKVTRAAAIGYPLSTDLEDSVTPVTIGTPALRTLGDMLDADTRSALIGRKSPSVSSKVVYLVGFLSPGHSGAPIVNRDAKVLAVVSGGLGEGSGVSWAFPVASIHWTKASNEPRLAALRKHRAVGLYYSPLKGPDLSIGIKRMEHTYFYLYSQDEARSMGLPTTTPSYSMLTGSTDFNVHYLLGDPFLLSKPNESWNHWVEVNTPLFKSRVLSNKSGGITMSASQTLIDPRAVLLPEGEAVFDFLVGNSGSSGTTIDGVYIDLISTKKLPYSFAGEFLPAFKVFKDLAVIRRSQKSYPMLNDDILRYDPGQNDIFRFSVRIADEEEPGLYCCRLRIKHTSEGHQFETLSEPFWVAKYFGGMTNRNVYAKFHSDAPPQSSVPLALKHVDGINATALPEHYSTHELATWAVHTALEDFDIPGFIHDTAENWMAQSMGIPDEPRSKSPPWLVGQEAQYAISNLESAISDTTRTPVQRFGFTVDGLQGSPSAFIGLDLGSTTGGSADPYSSSKYGDSHAVEVYEHRSTKLYHAVVAAVAIATARGNASEVSTLSNTLVTFSRRPELDVASLCDLVPMLATVNTDQSLARIAELLLQDSPVVQNACCEAFASYRWPQASARIADLFFSGSPYVQGEAGRALELSGTQLEARLLASKVLSSGVKKDELYRVSSTLVNLAPDLVEHLLKDPATSKDLRAALQSVTSD